MAPSLERFQIYENEMEDLSQKAEVRCGSLVMISQNKNQPDLRVLVRLYRTTWDNFAVLYPDKKACKAIGCINLRNCKVEREGKAFRVVQRSCDAVALAFHAVRSDETEEWINAFRLCCPEHTAEKSTFSQSSRRGKISLPAVLEEEDIEE